MRGAGTMTMTNAPARPADREMIPRALLRGMLALALAVLAITAFAVTTDRPHVGVPKAAAPLAERLLVLEGRGAQAVAVRDAEGRLLMELDHGGFITVIQNGLERVRRVARTEGNPPIRLVAYDNGRLVAEDPATGWSAELHAFGDDNRAAFARLLDN